jgi:bla regulator protein blaR1
MPCHKLSLLTVAIVMSIPATGLSAQSQIKPAFEFATVKVNKPGERRGLAVRYLPGGRFSASAVPIPLLIAEAYDTASLNPGPEFQKLDVRRIERDVYDIEAVAAKDAIPPGLSSKDRLEKEKQMLQSLLAERFKLRVHHEMKEQTVYAVVIAKNGPKLQGQEECADKPTDFFDPASCHTMADLIKLAQRTARLELPIIDKTGLRGLYSIASADWSAIIPGPKQPEDPTLPTFADILGKLGLKLETQKAVVDMLFVDYVEPPSTDN